MYSRSSQNPYQPYRKTVRTAQSRIPRVSYTAPRPKRHRFRRAALVVAALAFVWASMPSHHSAAAPIPEIKSGIAGRCLAAAASASGGNAKAVSAPCDGSTSQDWKVVNLAIVHTGNQCLSVQGDDQSHGAAIVAKPCTGAPGQVWLHDGAGLMNPNSGLCLSAPAGAAGQQLAIRDCDVSQPSQQWKPATSKAATGIVPAACTNSSEGEKIACVAAQQWSVWQSNPSSRAALLNSYTDGNGYEQWCADFVSYVYKQAGYPLTNGERDGWDEYQADGLQYDGFVMHDAASYTPKPGDVAYFNYPGGHVEIVVSGGKTPTFVYGDSAATDPVTGNGAMAANTIMQDDGGVSGQVVYYLSPR